MTRDAAGPPLWLKLGFSLGLVGLGLALGEAGLRLTWDNPYAGEDPDRVVRLRLHHAGTDHPVDRAVIDPEHPRVRYRTDARSYALPSAVHEDPDVTIAFLGGSTTECFAVREDLRFPALVGDLLGEAGLRANVLNAARSGGTTHDSLNVLLNHVVADRPDVVVMMHAANDVGVLAREGDYGSRMGQLDGPSTAVRWTLHRLSQVSSVVGVTRSFVSRAGAQAGPGEDHVRPSEQHGLDPEPFRQRLRAFVGLARAFDAEPVLMTQPLAGVRNELTPSWSDAANQEVFNAVIREVGAAEDVVVVDLAHHVSTSVDRWEDPMVVFYDGMHVTDDGSRIFARHIAERLLETVLLDERVERQHALETR